MFIFHRPRLTLVIALLVSAATTGCAVGHPTSNTVFLTEKADTTPVVVPVGTTIDVRLSKMRWTEIQASDQGAPQQVLQRTARPLPGEDGAAAATFVATHPGKVTLMAQGRANCAPGQACPRFLVQWSRTIEIVDAKP